MKAECLVDGLPMTYGHLKIAVGTNRQTARKTHNRHEDRTYRQDRQTKQTDFNRKVSLGLEEHSYWHIKSCCGSSPARVGPQNSSHSSICTTNSSRTRATARFRRESEGTAVDHNEVLSFEILRNWSLRKAPKVSRTRATARYQCYCRISGSERATEKCPKSDRKVTDKVTEKLSKSQRSRLVFGRFRVRKK
jgi:hypothetical protein